MLGGRNKTLKAQDILLLLKMLSYKEKYWRIVDFANELAISASEISMGLERLKFCGLINSDKRKLYPAAVLEFLIHGLKYVFPAHLGTITRGIPTAHSHASNKKFISDIAYVWPSEEGDIKGVGISPLYESVPHAVQSDKKLYFLLSLIDLLRVGRVREQNYAKKELEKELLSSEL
jgi:hypothetical protein